MQSSWRPLISCESECFGSGLLLRFKTPNNNGRFWEYALSVALDSQPQLSFISLDGQSWGSGRSMLPPESRYQGRYQTLSRLWLVQNLAAITNMYENDVYAFERTLIDCDGERYRQRFSHAISEVLP